MGRDRFGTLLFGAAGLLFAALLLALVFNGPVSWAVGLLYIGYDTWLLSHMVRASRRAVAAAAKDAPSTDVVRPTLAVLISARNEREALPATLDSVLAQDDRPEQIIV